MSPYYDTYQLERNRTGPVMAYDANSIAWDDAPKALDPAAIKWDAPDVFSEGAAQAAAQPDTQNNLGSLLDVAKQAGNFGLVVPNTIAAGLAGIGKTAITGDPMQGADVARNWQEGQPFSAPQTDLGKALSGAVNYPFENIDRTAEQAREAMPNHPALGTIAETGINALPWVLGGLHAALNVPRGMEAPPPEHVPFANAEPPQSVAPVQPPPVADPVQTAVAETTDALTGKAPDVAPPPAQPAPNVVEAVAHPDQPPSVPETPQSASPQVEPGAAAATLPESQAAIPTPAPEPTGPNLLGMRDEIGWDQRGGNLLRAPLKDNAGALGEVTGRLQWLPKASQDGEGYSTFWRNRPEPISEADAHEALDKFASGEPMRPVQQRFVDYATKMQGHYDEAHGEQMRQFADQMATEHPEIAPEDYGAAHDVSALAARAQAAGLDAADITPYHGETDAEYTARTLQELTDYEAQHADHGTNEVNHPENVRQEAGPPVAPEAGPVAEPIDSGGGDTAVATRPADTRADNASPADTQAKPTVDTGTEVRNAAVDEQRARIGLDELPPAEREHWQEASDKAAAGIETGDIQPRALAAEVAAKPRALTSTETMALAHDLKSLSDEHATATRDAVAAKDRGDTIGEAQARIRMQSAVDAMETNHAALRNGGTEAARSLSIRNAILKDDYTVGRNMDRARVAYGDKFNNALKKEVEGLSAQLKEAQARAAKLEADAASRRSTARERVAAEKMTPDEKMQARIQKQMDALQKSIDQRLKACPI
jgi:hypothetical protein